jgi:hypothetical protein
LLLQPLALVVFALLSLLEHLRYKIHPNLT